MKKPEYEVRNRVVAIPRDSDIPPLVEPNEQRPVTLADLRVLEARVIAEIKEMFA